MLVLRAAEITWVIFTLETLRIQRNNWL